MKIGIFYFSATGVTKEYSRFFEKVLRAENHEVELYNILFKEVRTRRIELNYDGCIFGFPVYGGRLPTVCEEWIKSLEGNNSRCSMFFTYGGRALEYAHQITFYLLTEVNFKVVLSAEFLGRHSFNVADGWSLAADRPNSEDYKIGKEFIKKTLELFNADSIEWKIDLSRFNYKPKVQKPIKGPFAIFLPRRVDQHCSMCLRCETECPTQAFVASTGQAINRQCILCMYCVTICPDQVIEVGNATSLFQRFQQTHSLSKENVKQKSSKIIYTKTQS
ncbi:MAG: EFR1 family ferrodoxin [Candidatus Hermodarchaeota archaeon]